MNVLNNLEPKAVFRFFEEICDIPHGSTETKAISDYIASFARERNLKYRQDELNNVVIWKKASPGYENAPTVMIQGHMDMVCEKEDDCTKDMSKEGLDLFVDGDLVGAKGTTLGGDDGIAVAMALAVLDDDSIPHGPLECVFTVDEEVGMGGARNLDVSTLSARYMLNIDSEKDKVFTVSCAGSTRILCKVPVRREAFEGETVEIHIEGLKGGHSGEEIHMGRANANILMGRVLYELMQEMPLRLIDVKGGAKDNAIPRSATAVVSVSNAEKAVELVSAISAVLQNEYYTPDSGVKAHARKAEFSITPADEDSTRRAVCFMYCVPNGVQYMSAEVPGLVQTSLNLGITYTEEDFLAGSMMLRSSVNTQNKELLEKVTALCNCLGGTVNVNSTYNAWEYRHNSKIRDIMTEAFREIYGEEPVIEALHAGLECGILSGNMPDLDCISFGPDLTDIHTPRERLHIESTGRIWKLLLATLKKAK